MQARWVAAQTLWRMDFLVNNAYIALTRRDFVTLRACCAELHEVYETLVTVEETLSGPLLARAHDAITFLEQLLSKLDPVAATAQQGG